MSYSLFAPLTFDAFDPRGHRRLVSAKGREHRTVLYRLSQAGFCESQGLPNSRSLGHARTGAGIRSLASTGSANSVCSFGFNLTEIRLDDVVSQVHFAVGKTYAILISLLVSGIFCTFDSKFSPSPNTRFYDHFCSHASRSKHELSSRRHVAARRDNRNIRLPDRL